jgi:hypothetical protein
MNNCVQTDTIIDVALEKELEHNWELTLHLNECDRCSGEFEQYSALCEELRQSEDTPIPRALEKRILSGAQPFDRINSLFWHGGGGRWYRSPFLNALGVIFFSALCGLLYLFLT